MNNLLLNGNSYFYIERDSSARPTGLIPIKSEDVKVINHEGDIYYDIKGFEIAILKEDMLHFFNFSFNGYEGTSVINAQSW